MVAEAANLSRTYHPDVMLTFNRWNRRPLSFTDTNGKVTTPDRDEAVYEELLFSTGFASFVRLFEPVVERFIFMSTEPSFPTYFGACISRGLAKEDASACDQPISYEGIMPHIAQHLNQTAAEILPSSRFIVVDPAPLLCPQSICPATFEDPESNTTTITYRDTGHVSPDYWIFLRYKLIETFQEQGYFRFEAYQYGSTSLDTW